MAGLKNIVVSLTANEIAAIFEAIDIWECDFYASIGKGSRETIAFQKRLNAVEKKLHKALQSSNI